MSAISSAYNGSIPLYTLSAFVLSPLNLIKLNSVSTSPGLILVTFIFLSISSDLIASLIAFTANFVAQYILPFGYAISPATEPILTTVQTLSVAIISGRIVFAIYVKPFILVSTILSTSSISY